MLVLGHMRKQTTENALSSASYSLDPTLIPPPLASYLAASSLIENVVVDNITTSKTISCDDVGHEQGQPLPINSWYAFTWRRFLSQDEISSICYA
jgi:hypothetical protein